MQYPNFKNNRLGLTELYPQNDSNVIQGKTVGILQSMGPQKCKIATMNISYSRLSMVFTVFLIAK